MAASPSPAPAPSTTRAEAKLFAEFPGGWVIRDWADVAKEPAQATRWWVDRDGVLHGSRERGTWLLSGAEFDDFELEFEFLLSNAGNSGVALRAPLRGDPAYEGLEVQLVDPAYYGDEKVQPSQLTGSIYLAVAPAKQVFRPLEWNRCRIRCERSRVIVVVNDEKIVDVNLDEHEKLKTRPRRGHIGFQELGRSGGRVQIRKARLRVLTMSS